MFIEQTDFIIVHLKTIGIDLHHQKVNLLTNFVHNFYLSLSYLKNKIHSLNDHCKSKKIELIFDLFTS